MLKKNSNLTNRSCVWLSQKCWGAFFDANKIPIECNFYISCRYSSPNISNEFISPQLRWQEVITILNHSRFDHIRLVMQIKYAKEMIPDWVKYLVFRAKQKILNKKGFIRLQIYHMRLSILITLLLLSIITHAQLGSYKLLYTQDLWSFATDD